jgi:heme-degrading monooxygenase HmoA
MYARVWKISLLPENVQPFASACHSVGVLNSSKEGYRGLLVLRGGPLDNPDATVVSLWDSLEALRASESEAFQEAVAQALACCQPGALLREEEILVWSLPAPDNNKASKRKVKRKAGRKIRAKRRPS